MNSPWKTSPSKTYRLRGRPLPFFAQVLPWRDTIGLYVEITTQPVKAEYDDGEGYPYRIAPTFFTELLEIPVATLKTRGLDLLDGYSMRHDAATEVADGFEQYPGAIDQNDQLGLQRAALCLAYPSTRLRGVAKGVTELRWRFRIVTGARPDGVIVKSGKGPLPCRNQ